MLEPARMRRGPLSGQDSVPLRSLVAVCGVVAVGCSCGPPPRPDAAADDSAVDAQFCFPDTDLHDGFLIGLGNLSYIGPAAERSGLRVGWGDGRVTASRLVQGSIQEVWSTDPREATAGSLRWEGDSIAAIGLDARTRQVLHWRPVTGAAEFVLPLHDRWPYSPLGACATPPERVVPSATRLWLFRYVQCPDGPEFGSAVHYRLHGFAVGGEEVTSSEGIPLPDLSFGTGLMATIQPQRDDGVGYLVRDSGTDGLDMDAIRWERRDANATVVSRSAALVSGSELTGSELAWTAMDGDAVVVYVYLDSPPMLRGVFARVEADGEVRWLHTFPGYVASTDTSRGRVQLHEGGIVALMVKTDRSSQSVLRIAEDGTVLIAPGEMIVRGAPTAPSAISADAWGFTVLLADPDAMGPLTLQRRDWSGTLFWENVLDGTGSALDGFSVFLRSDGVGGTYAVTMAGTFQHHDAFGREAAFLRQTSCPPAPYRNEIVPIDRPPIDAGLDAARIRPDADVDRDAEIAPDSAAETVDAGVLGEDASSEDASGDDASSG